MVKYVVITGCFRLLHAGHIDLIMSALQYSARFNATPIALINSDEYLEEHKGKVIQPFYLRHHMFTKLGFHVIKSDNHINVFERLKSEEKRFLYVNADFKSDCKEVEWCIKNGYPIILIRPEHEIHLNSLINDSSCYACGVNHRSSDGS